MTYKILYCSHTPELKGSAISLHQLITGVDRDRFTPFAAFSKPGSLVDRLGADGISVSVLEKRGFLNFGLIRQAMRLMRSEGINLVHLNSAVPFCKCVGIAAWFMSIPVVWHIREDPEGKRVKKLKKWIELLATRIMVVSTDLLVAFEHSGRAVKIYNGVDTSRFRPGMDGTAFRERCGIPAGAFVFGMVGSIEGRKGNVAFMRAAGELIAEGIDAWFVIVGSGLPDEEARLAGFIKANPALERRVVCTGRLSDIPEALAGLDVLVMPSVWEGFPRALVEAMACGLPAIATEVGEVGHMLDNGVSGIVIPKEDQAALLTAMRDVMTKVDLKQMGAQARIKAEGFTAARHIETVEAEYLKIIEGA